MALDILDMQTDGLAWTGTRPIWGRLFTGWAGFEQGQVGFGATIDNFLRQQKTTSLMIPEKWHRRPERRPIHINFGHMISAL